MVPFIGLLNQHVDVVTLDSPTDYRMQKNANLPVYLTPLGPDADRAQVRGFAVLSTLFGVNHLSAVRRSPRSWSRA